MTTNNTYKRVVLAYFSGTGCTEEVCNCFEEYFLKKEIEVTKINIAKSNLPEDLDKDLLIILSPVYAFRLASIAEKWVENLKEVKSTKAVVISVSGGGDISPNTACREKCKKLLIRKGYEVVYEKMIVMPSNFSIQAEEELNDRLLGILPNKVKNIIDEILDNKTNLTKPMPQDRLFSVLGRAEHFGAKFFGASIKATKTCNGCGKCASCCPQKNIVMINAMPKFKFNCIFCLKCIYNCPQKALSPRIMKSVVLKEGFNIKDFKKEEAPKGIYTGEKSIMWKGAIDYLDNEEKEDNLD